MIPRIIAIAPVIEDRDENGNYRGDMTMYWIAYEDLRSILVQEEVYNPHNQAVGMHWDHLFQSRKFSSIITKTSNVHDRSIQEYKTGLDALLEAERIKTKLSNYEHDMWSY